MNFLNISVGEVIKNRTIINNEKEQLTNNLGIDECADCIFGNNY